MDLAGSTRREHVIRPLDTAGARLKPSPAQDHPETKQLSWGARAAALAAYPATWLTLTATVAVVDLISGPHLSFGLLYLVPLAVAAWYGSTPIALTIAILLPMVRLSFFAFDLWEPPGTFAHVALNASVRAGILILIVLLIRRTRRAGELERELAVLRGMLPICMYCKRIQDAEGHWQPVEQFVGARSGAAFTHRVCPICTDTHRDVFLGSTR